MPLPSYGFDLPVTLAEVNIVVVIPAYNEARHIGEVIASVPEFVRSIVVVDDCSRDETAQV